VESRVPHRIESFKMLDQNGLAIDEKRIEGKVHLANFMFTSCASICPVMTKNINAVHTHFADNDDVVILSFSVTPWKDSVAALKRFEGAYDIRSDNWHFLTGNKAEIYDLARRSYFAEEDIGFSKDSSDFLHTEHVILVDRNRRIRGIYNGTLQLEMEQAIRDIAQLLKE